MERYQQVFLYTLQPNDRFYFAGDKKKKVYTLDSSKPFEIKIQKGWKVNYANCHTDINGKLSIETEPHKANRRVIFLRNINDPV